MKMKKLLLILVLQLGITSLNAQEIKFGKISSDDFNSLDSTSVATVLFKKQKTFYEYRVDDGFVQVSEYFKRIKINKKEGLDYANIIVEIYDELATKKEIIKGIKGITYNLNNGDVEKTKLKSKEVYKEKYNKYWKKIKIVMPNVNVGSIIDVKYYTESPFVSRIQDVVLQESIPVKEFDCQINIPEYFTFDLHENIKSNYKIKLIEDGRQISKDIKWKEKVNRKGGFVLEEFQRTLNYKDRIIKFNEKNIDALKGESFSVELNNYVIKLAFDLQLTKSFNNIIKNHATNWDLITKKIYDSESFGGELNKTKYFKKGLESILQNNPSDSDKINAILNYVKSKVKWNGLTGYFPDLGLKRAFVEGKGNVADVNLMLVAMLKYAGISANPVLLSTKANGEALYPTRQGFNYVICGIEVKNQVLLLDATENYTTFNILPERVLNWKGRIIREHGSSTWINLFPKKNSSKTTMISASLDNDMTFTGKVRSQETDYFAYNYRNRNSGLVSEDLIKRLSKDKGEIDITNFNVNNVKGLDKPIQQSYAFSYEDGTEKIGSEVYVYPMLFLTETDNIFNKENRKYPIDFSFPRTNKNIININIPEGYRVKSIPESVKLLMSDDLGEYSFLVKQNGNTIQVSELFKLNFPIVPVSYYPELKSVYKKLIEKNAEKIVLEKI